MLLTSKLSVLAVGLVTAIPALAADPAPAAPAKALVAPLGAVNTNPAILPPVFVPAEPVPPPAAAPPVTPIIELTTLKLLLAKGVISQDEFDSAMKDLNGLAPRPAESATVNIAGWKTTLYGFAQLDLMWDSTQSFNDFLGNGQVARPDTYAGVHPRFQATIRDSRFGFRVAPPAWGDIRVSGNLEFDFLGAEGNGTIASTTGTVSEAGFFVNPVLRIRHAWGKIETPIVDVLFGQTWDLFGWLPNFVPAIVQWPGTVGELYARTPQVRVSKTIKTEYVNVELAVAAMRPPQRDAAVPEGQAGARIMFNKWQSWHSGYLTGTSLVPASIGVSGTLRQFAVGVPCTFTAPATTCASTTTNFALGSGIALSALIPIIPAVKGDKSNSLTLVGEFVSGTSINDLYTGFTGGVSSALPAGTTFTGTIDSGLVAYDSSGKLVQPHWLTSIVGLEYVLPSGRATLFVNWGHTQLSNASEFSTAPKALRNHSNLYEGGLLVDVTQQVRVALGYARVVDGYADGVDAVNNRVQATAHFFF